MAKAKTMKNGRVLLPKLRKVDYLSKKEKYHLRDPTSKRHLAIDKGIRAEMKKTKRNMRKAAVAKKGRFNILRIYRRNNNVGACKKITRDMRYMNRKYGLGKTADICGKKKTNKNMKKNTMKRKNKKTKKTRKTRK